MQKYIQIEQPQTQNIVQLMQTQRVTEREGESERERKKRTHTHTHTDDQ